MMLFPTTIKVRSHRVTPKRAERARVRRTLQLEWLEERKVPAQVCTSAVDMMIIVDGTGSVGSSNFDLEKQAIQQLAASFSITAAETHIGIVQLGSPTTTTLELPLSSNATTVNTTAAGLVYQNAGSTALGSALQVAQQELAADGRHGVATPVIVMMTDGQNNDGPDPITVASQVKQAGTIIYTLGIGTGVDEAQLKAIASDPNTGYFPATSFNDLAPVIQQIATTTCVDTSSPPVVIPRTYTISVNTTLSVAAPGLLAGTTDSNPAHTAFTAVLISQPSHGHVTLNTDGSFTYVPNSGFVGQDSFKFAANDGVDTGGPANATINVMPAAPKVIGIARYGYHAHPTRLVLSFNQPMDATAAMNLRNYLLVDTTHGNHLVPIRLALYNYQAHTVTLFPSRLLPLNHTYRLLVNGTSPLGLKGTDGLFLSGSGTAGTDYVVNFGSNIFVPPMLPVHLRASQAVALNNSTPHGPAALVSKTK